MSTKNNSTDTNATQIQKDVCIACLDSFGVQDQSKPYQCIQPNCQRNYCASCIETINRCNGTDRPFQCMFCLFKYPINKKPVVKKLLLGQLWASALAKYGFSQKAINSTGKTTSKKDLQFELECRCYHLKHLLKTQEQFNNWDRVESAFKTKNDACGLITQLENILNQVKSNSALSIEFWEREYHRIVTLPNHSIGSFLIDVCERLNFEIMNAELRALYPMISERYIQWNCTLGSGDQFQPKINQLFKAAEIDITTLSSNPHRTLLRTKIGFIGYTSAGKTTLMYRLLELDQSQGNQFLPIRTTKSTYYPLQFDREKPLIDPDNPNIKTPVKFIDIQGSDQGQNVTSNTFEAGNYLDEIRKADCDIYVLVFNNDLMHEQYKWIDFIEQLLQRTCILVRSKVDVEFLNKFQEQNDNTSYEMSSEDERNEYSEAVIADLRRRFQVSDRHVFVTAANLRPNKEASLLLENQSFDLKLLLNELSRCAPGTRSIRLQNSVVRSVQRVINSCFRCGYVLNVMKYKITTGIVAIIPLADLIPRYVAKGSIEEVFGIDKHFLESLSTHNLEVIDEQLQTLVFNSYVAFVTKPKTNSNKGSGTSGSLAMSLTLVGGALADDIARAAIPVASTLSGAARIALGVATFGAGLALSAGVCVWSANNTGKHIFSFVNCLCDDIIIISIPFMKSFIERELNGSIA